MHGTDTAAASSGASLGPSMFSRPAIRPSPRGLPGHRMPCDELLQAGCQPGTHPACTRSACSGTRTHADCPACRYSRCGSWPRALPPRPRTAGGSSCATSARTLGGLKGLPRDLGGLLRLPGPPDPQKENDCAAHGSLGSESYPESDERGTGRRVEKPPDARAPQSVAEPGDDSCVAAQPSDGHRGEDEAECEHRGE
jgi:hypothetical protein